MINKVYEFFGSVFLFQSFKNGLQESTYILSTNSLQDFLILEKWRFQRMFKAAELSALFFCSTVKLLFQKG